MVVALVGGVDALRAVKAVGEWAGEPSLLCALEKPPLSPAGPLHRRAHCESSWDVEVFGHPDLLAVEQDRSARQGEGE